MSDFSGELPISPPMPLVIPAALDVDGDRPMLRTWRSLWAPRLFRGLTMAAQIATVIITWPLWQVRATPPLLPLVPLPECDMGWAVIATAVLVVFLPRWGLAAQAVVLGLAMLQDQTRMQPEFISLWLLALATLPSAGARLVGRAHLASLWFFSGFHKLLSAGYYARTVPWLFGGILPADMQHRVALLGTLAASLEVALGVMAVIPRTRRVAAVIALPFHLGVVMRLVQLDFWNASVWPWNIALAFAGLALLWDHRDAPWVTFSAARWPGRILAAVLVFSPLGYYLGLMDGYLAHCLYSSNLPHAYILHEFEYHDVSTATWEPLHVPLPPAERVFRQYFRAVGRPGDVLVIEDLRWCARALWHNDYVEVPWEESGQSSAVGDQPDNEERADR